MTETPLEFIQRVLAMVPPASPQDLASIGIQPLPSQVAAGQAAWGTTPTILPLPSEVTAGQTMWPTPPTILPLPSEVVAGQTMWPTPPTILPLPSEVASQSSPLLFPGLRQSNWLGSPISTFGTLRAPSTPSPDFLTPVWKPTGSDIMGGSGSWGGSPNLVYGGGPAGSALKKAAQFAAKYLPKAASYLGKAALRPFTPQQMIGYLAWKGAGWAGGKLLEQMSKAPPGPAYPTPPPPLRPGQHGFV